MTRNIERFSPTEIGERLRMARETAKLTQAAAAAASGMARTTLVAIEQGQRKLRMDDLLLLTKLYGASVNGLSRQEAIHIDPTPKIRMLPASPEASDIEMAASLLTNLAKAEAELEGLLGIHRVRNYPQRRPILHLGSLCLR